MSHGSYYVPHQSHWPIVGAIALFFVALGAGQWVNEIKDQKDGFGVYLLALGLGILLYMIVGWFKNVITESMTNQYSLQVHHSFRQGMMWFIVSEVMFFAIFFGALFYARIFSVPWLGGADNNQMTHAVLWPDFQAHWPLIHHPSGETNGVMGWQGLPLVNTIILIISSITIHLSHHALKKSQQRPFVLWLAITIVLAASFLALQVYEYRHAYQELNLTLDGGIYGNTFFMLTGFHGLHVTLGMTLLIVMLCRAYKNHFTADKHFAFQAATWYWHFVDVVWLNLFIFVYVF